MASSIGLTSLVTLLCLGERAPEGQAPEGMVGSSSLRPDLATTKSHHTDSAGMVAAYANGHPIETAGMARARAKRYHTATAGYAMGHPHGRGMGLASLTVLLSGAP